VRKVAVASLQAQARAFAAGIKPAIERLRGAGAQSLNAIARGLSAEGVLTARGSTSWTPTAVRRVLALID
jgi:hypothetical protein